MKKQIINLLFVLAGAAGLTSCENWLDETSNSEIREEDHFATEEGFRQSLIGCYINMTDESLYGKELSWGLVETLGRQFQPFTTTASSSNYYLQNYNYKHSTAVGRVENIWAKAYNVIANANAALAVSMLVSVKNLSPSLRLLMKSSGTKKHSFIMTLKMTIPLTELSI